MLTKITLRNSFHGTEASLRPMPIRNGRWAGLHRISRRTALRLHKELCGHSDCTCGDTFGARDGQYLSVVNEDWDNSYIIDLAASHYEGDGSYPV